MENIEMKELIEDTLKLSASVKELLLTPTPTGKVHHKIRISRPNWSASECFKAARWMKRRGLQAVSSFSAEEEYLEYLAKQLQEYDKAFPVRGQHEVADELSLSRWEARWQRVRSRQLQRDERNSVSAVQVASAA